MKTIYSIIGMALSLTAPGTMDGRIARPAEALPQIETVGQTGHALELLKRTGSSYLLTDSSHADLRPYVLEAVEASLPAEFHQHAFAIARAVILEGNHHKMDPFFLLAVIKTESKFNMDAVGTHGELGLMQILPSTAAWLAAQAGLPENPDLRDPAVNIRLGAVYIAQLRKAFANLPQRYVGAYNMGPRNVRRLVASNTEPSIYPSKVLGNYKSFYREVDHAMSNSTATVAFDVAE